MKKMRKSSYRYIYGPVASWRLGRSLGIDPISKEEKICTFDCIYCQIGKTENFTDQKKVLVPTQKIIEELKSLSHIDIDYITFSGRGEPTLAKNLDELIKEIKNIRKEKVAVITNSSLIDRGDVQEDLRLADLVMLKLDAPSQKIFSKVNRPMEGVVFDRILKGIKEFKSSYKGRLALQIMFVEENKNLAKALAVLAKEINPDEVQINTPLRPCKVKPLSKKDIDAIKESFDGMNIISIYDTEKKEVEPISKGETLRRRGKL